MSGSAGGQVIRSLVTQLSFKLDGLREAEAAFKALQAKAQQIGDIRFRVSGLQEAQAALARLQTAARSAVAVPVGRAAVAAPVPAAAAVAPSTSRIAAPSVPTLPPMQVRLRGVEEARAALASLRSMAQATAGAFAGIGASFSVGKLIEAGDSMTRATDRIRASLETVGGSAEDVYEKLYRTAQRTGIAVEAGATTFVQIQNAVADLGGKPEQVLQVVEGMQQAGAIAGSKAADVAEAMRQMSQALGSTRLAGDELRSMMERMPQLARALAKELGVPVGQLKEMGSRGELTSQVVWPALIRASGQFREQFDRLNVTFDRAKGVANVTFTRFLADLDKAIGLTPTLAAGLLKITQWVDGLRSRLGTVRQFVHDLGGIKSVLEVTAISAGVATLAFTRFGASLIVPGAVVLGIAAVGAVLQDLWIWVRGRGGSLAGDLFGDFGTVAERARTALGVSTWEQVLAPLEQRLRTTRVEWEALKASFTPGGGGFSLASDAFGGMARSGEAMWAVVGPILRTLVLGPGEVAKEWANLRAAVGDPLKAIGGFFDDVAARASNVYTRVTELAEKLREFLARVGLVQIPKGETVSREPFGPPAPGAGGAAAGPRAAPRPAIRDENGQPMYSPSSWSPNDYMNQLPGRMGRAQTIAASQAVTVHAPITVNATGVSGAEVAAATQKGMGQAINRGFGESRWDEAARMIGFDFSRIEPATGS